MLLRSEYRCELLWVRHGFRRGNNYPIPTYTMYLDVRCIALVVFLGNVIAWIANSTTHRN